MHEFSDNVERVEKKMWLQLTLQHIKAGFGQTRSTLLVSPKIVQGVRTTNDHQINRQTKRNQVKQIDPSARRWTMASKRRRCSVWWKHGRRSFELNPRRW